MKAKTNMTKVDNQLIQTKRGDTVTLTMGSRVLKVKKNRHWRYDVIEQGRKIDEFSTLHDIRKSMTLGQI